MFRPIPVVIAALAITASSASAQTDEEIEAALAADSSPPPAPAPLASLNPDLTLILDTAAAWFSGDDEPLQTGGHDPTSDGFSLQALELAIGKSVDPYFRFDASIAFGLEEVELEEAYATTLALPHALQVRAGQFLTRFGRINSTHLHRWDFVDQPLAIGQVFGAEGQRGPGAELSWLSPLPWFAELSGSVTEIDERMQATAALKQFFELSPDWSLLGGLSYSGGRNGAGDDLRTHVGGVDLYLKWRPISEASTQIVSLQSEWLLRRSQEPGGRVTDVAGYTQLFWRFARRWGTAARHELGTADEQRVSAALTFWPTEFSRVRAQGAVTLPGGDADPIWATFLNLEVAVGAHGAHQF